MDELYRIHSSLSCDQVHERRSSDSSRRGSVGNNVMGVNGMMMMGSEMSGVLLKSQIANHPLYPNLVSAYIDCRKVGAPPEMASILEEISKENHPVSSPIELGTDPELDHFMESYCEALNKYKEELLKPFDEATIFLNNIESQLTNLCNQNLATTTTTTTSSLSSPNCHSDEAGGGGICTSDEDLSCGEVEVGESQESSTRANGQAENELKGMLMRKYSGYLSELRTEFLKKRKKGKLPKNARIILLHWWNSHYRWPYPTEDEKNKLSEVTGLDQRQINNWFINQRKRHWKPSEDMRFALMQGVTGGTLAGPPPPMYFDTAGGGGGGGTGT